MSDDAAESEVGDAFHWGEAENRLVEGVPDVHPYIITPRVLPCSPPPKLVNNFGGPPPNMSPVGGVV